jgi:hypothetical protein
MQAQTENPMEQTSPQPGNPSISGDQLRLLTPADSLDEWDALVDASPQGTVFCRSFWLRALLGQNFEILTLRRGGQLVGGMPLPHPNGSPRLIMHPPFTQVLGVVLASSKSSSYEGRLSYQMEAMETLVGALPRFNYFRMNLHYSIQNWLPFYWAGFQQTTVYTYAIEDLSDMEAVVNNFDHSKRKNLKRAKTMVGISYDLEPRVFYDHHVMTLAKQGARIQYSYDTFARIHSACRERRNGRIFHAVDPQGVIHAAIFVVWDAHSAYYLISSIDPAHRNSGAATLLLLHAMTELAAKTRRFDFEGSMIPGVENSFRRFGATQKPILRVTKDNRSSFSRALSQAKRLLARLTER